MDRVNLLTFCKVNDFIKMAKDLGFVMSVPIDTGLDSAATLTDEDVIMPLIFSTTYEDKSTGEVIARFKMQIIRGSTKKMGLMIKYLYNEMNAKVIRYHATQAFQALIECLAGGNELVKSADDPDAGDYNYQWIVTSEGKNLR